MPYKIVNKDSGSTVAASARTASTFFSRFLGLMFRKSIGKDEALIFYRAVSIHTCFMRFPIDIIFLDRNMKVKRLVEGMRPWRTIICLGACVTIELIQGKIAQSKTSLGDKVEIQAQR